jgi:hypothetical protein
LRDLSLEPLTGDSIFNQQSKINNQKFADQAPTPATLTARVEADAFLPQAKARPGAHDLNHESLEPSKPPETESKSPAQPSLLFEVWPQPLPPPLWIEITRITSSQTLTATHT